MKILNIEQEKLTIENVKELFDKYYNANDPKNGGSFYLQSKIYRAKERLELDLDPDKDKDKEETETQVNEEEKEEIHKGEDVTKKNVKNSKKLLIIYKKQGCKIKLRRNCILQCNSLLK